MSFIIDNTNGFVSVKLTNKGRELLGKGQLTFNKWAIGDSEINYQREFNIEGDNVPKSKILLPKDFNPNIKNILRIGSNDLNDLLPGNINLVEASINNKAKQRGFFSGTTDNYETLLSEYYVKTSGLVGSDEFFGTTDIEIVDIDIEIGDLILFKIGNDVYGNVSVNETTNPIYNLWFKVIDKVGDLLTLDRELPDLSAFSTTDCAYLVYKSGEVANEYASDCNTFYWDSETLNFEPDCVIDNKDVLVLNMNIVHEENPTALTGTTLNIKGYESFDSYDYLGLKNDYLGLGIDSDSFTNLDNICDGFGILDTALKSLGVIHYTNNTIGNYYGEHFYINSTENKNLTLILPNIMYHRRYFSDGIGDIMGMEFVSGDTLKTESVHEYYDLIEKPTMIDGTPLVVGRVYHKLKIVVITDEELLVSLMYKSNRNYTLPALTANLINPVTNDFSLEVGKTMYLTYTLESTVGVKNILPCQKYVKVTNTTNRNKDVTFNINGLGLLPYMRKIESSWDGLGFYADGFKLLYQIVNDPNERPNPDDWKEIDYTSTDITGVISETINPTLLENQNPNTIGFIIDETKINSAVDYSITDKLNLPDVNDDDNLNFGSERFLYGNLDTYIGATIYKTIFTINVNSDSIKQTSNPTKIENTVLHRISEIGIYNNNSELVVIGKLSRPLELQSGKTITFELSIDF